MVVHMLNFIRPSGYRGELMYRHIEVSAAKKSYSVVGWQTFTRILQIGVDPGSGFSSASTRGVLPD